MSAYIIRRLLLVIPTLLLVSFVVFMMVHFMPGDIIDSLQESFGEKNLDRPAFEHAYGLDKPLIIQYGRWMGVVPQMDGSFRGIFQGDLGASWWRKASVVKIIGVTWPITLELGLMGIILAQLVGLSIGIISALRQDTWVDYIGRSFAILCISIPSFWLATLIIVLPSIWWDYMPSIIHIPFTEDLIGNLKMFIVPAMVLGMALCGITMRMTRSMMLEVLRQDYIKTAWAKGLRERMIVLRHALKNTLIAVVTIVGLQMSSIVGATVLIESIFCLPGMGRLLLQACSQRDEPLISGIALFLAVVLMLINLIVDLIYGFLDPRVRYR